MVPPRGTYCDGNQRGSNRQPGCTADRKQCGGDFGLASGNSSRQSTTRDSSDAFRRRIPSHAGCDVLLMAVAVDTNRRKLLSRARHNRAHAWGYGNRLEEGCSRILRITNALAIRDERKQTNACQRQTANPTESKPDQFHAASQRYLQNRVQQIFGPGETPTARLCHHVATVSLERRGRHRSNLTKSPRSRPRY